MSKIQISIPTSKGEQYFFLSRTALIALIFLVVSTPIVITLGIVLYQAQAKDHQQAMLTHRTTIATLEEERSELTKQLSASHQSTQAQIEENHELTQDLQKKNNQLVILGKRVYDVESVLGINEDAELALDSSLEQRLDSAAIDSAVRATMFRLIPNDSPMDYLRISSSYGRRTNPITNKRHTHTGIDLTCKRGEAIIAPADGVIETVRPSKKGFGNFLSIRHSFGFTSSYAHLKTFKARSGQFVSKGDIVALCGNSGNSTGPHLHYEVRFLGRSLNPQYLMDWTPENFNYVFEKEKKVKWAPLVDIIADTVKLQVNLTNTPYVDSSLKTVSTVTANQQQRSIPSSNN